MIALPAKILITYHIEMHNDVFDTWSHFPISYRTEQEAIEIASSLTKSCHNQIVRVYKMVHHYKTHNTKWIDE